MANFPLEEEEFGVAIWVMNPTIRLFGERSRDLAAERARISHGFPLPAKLIVVFEHG